MRSVCACSSLPLVALLAACGGTSPTPPSASPRAGWQPAEQVAAPGPSTAEAMLPIHLSLALDPDGSATLAWDALGSDESWRPYAARRSPTGAWGPVAALSEGTGREGSYTSVSGGAQPIVAWRNATPDQGGIWARCWSGGGWAPPVLVGGGRYAAFPQVVGSACSGLLVWGNVAPPYQAAWAFLDATRGWSPPQPLGTATVLRVGRSRDAVLVAFASNGQLVWSDDHGRGGNLGSVPLGYSFYAVGDDPSREAPDTWLAWDDGREIVASRWQGQSFGPRQTLASNTGFWSAAVASSRAGALFCLARTGETQPLGCARAQPGGDFGPLLPVAGPRGLIDAALDAQGQAVLTVAVEEAGVFAVRSDGPERWGSPERLDAPKGPTQFGVVRARGDGQGRWLVAWGEKRRSDLGLSVWSARYEP